MELSTFRKEQQTKANAIVIQDRYSPFQIGRQTCNSSRDIQTHERYKSKGIFLGFRELLKSNKVL